MIFLNSNFKSSTIPIKRLSKKRQNDVIDSTRTQLTVALPIFRIELPTKKSFRKIFVIKLSNLNFRGSQLSYFSAITYISVIGIWDPFDTFFPRSSATVKLETSSPNFRHLIMNVTDKLNGEFLLTHFDKHGTTWYHRTAFTASLLQEAFKDVRLFQINPFSP